MPSVDEENGVKHNDGEDNVVMSLEKSKLLTATSSIIIRDSKNDEKEGLMSPRAMLFLIMWYFFSFCTLFLNKYTSCQH